MIVFATVVISVFNKGIMVGTLSLLTFWALLGFDVEVKYVVKKAFREFIDSDVVKMVDKYVPVVVMIGGKAEIKCEESNYII